jgi:hypothetical protein
MRCKTRWPGCAASPFSARRKNRVCGGHCRGVTFAFPRNAARMAEWNHR